MSASFSGIQKRMFDTSIDRGFSQHLLYEPNLERHRYNLALLMPCSGHTPSAGPPASACLKTAMTWLSVEPGSLRAELSVFLK